jgi:hypothetical protein
MSNDRTFHLAADIVNTSTASIKQALSGGNWSVRTMSSELTTSVGLSTSTPAVTHVTALTDRDRLAI